MDLFFLAIRHSFAMNYIIDFEGKTDYIGKFYRQDCLCRVRWLYQRTDGTFDTSNRSVFFYDRTFYSETNETYFDLTYKGAVEICGPGYGIYRDAVPRIFTWILPILLLISNIELSSIDKRRFMTVIHAFGDPIDSLWSLFYKYSILDRCYNLAGSYGAGDLERTRIIGTVFTGFEELMGPTIIL